MSAELTRVSLASFEKALANLEHTLTLPAQDADYRAATILAFMLSYETCWKGVRRVLAHAMGVKVDFAKPTFEAAYKLGWIAPAEMPLWLEMIKARSLMAQVYDETKAMSIYGQCAFFAQAMRQLMIHLKTIELLES